jgi:Cys-tRNA(Pro)/Cys-tRNA(Cys) deacylase
MTPAILSARRAGIEVSIHEYVYDSSAPSVGIDAATKLGIQPELVYKTLVVALDRQRMAVAVLPIERSLDAKAVAELFGAKRAELADPAAAERATGYVIGAISPIGQRKRLPVVLDESAWLCGTIYVSAGRRGLEIGVAPEDLVRLCGARTAQIAH